MIRPVALLFGVLLGLSAADGAKPWETAIAALTDSRAAVHQPAIERLIAHGEPALADVATLALDADWRVRGRVITVASAVGGSTAVAIVLQASRDPEGRVRELAALGLGKLPGEGVYERLVALLADRETAVRIAAVRGLTDLGDPRALVALADHATELDTAVRRERVTNLERLAARPAVVPAMIEALAMAKGDTLLRLVAATGRIGDPRLSPALAALLAHRDRDVAELAARSLAANGDSRCLEALCAVAANGPRSVAVPAAETLQVLTGFRAAPGQAWSVWWRDHATEAAAVAERDAFLASLHDVSVAVAPADLARFTPLELMPLVDGVLGDGAWWWPRRATEILLRDAAARWTEPLAQRIRATEDPDARLGVILLLDQLGDPQAGPVFAALLDEHRARLAATAKDRGAQRNDPTDVALEAAAARRRSGGSAPGVDTRPPFMR